MKFQTIKFLKSCVRANDFPSTGYPVVALAGRSNVGKSTFLNTISRNSKIARVSKNPGQTRAMNLFIVNENLYLVDLPGYGYAKLSKTMRDDFSRMIGEWVKSPAAPNLWILLLDARRKINEQDKEFMEWIRAMDTRVLLVYTKIDRMRSNELQRKKREVKSLNNHQGDTFFVSSKTREGITEVLKAIEIHLQNQ